MNDDSRKENIRRNSSESTFADVSSASTSPVFGRNGRSFKKRRNIEGNDSRRCVPTSSQSPILGKNSRFDVRKRRKIMGAVDLNMNSMGSSKTVVAEYSERERKIVCSRKLRLSFEEADERSHVDQKHRPDTYSTTRALLAARSNVRRKDEDDEKTEKIEIESSSDNDADDNGEMRINNSDSDANSIDSIQEEATQNTIVDRNGDLVKSPFLCTPTPDSSLDETFFSEAERSPRELISTVCSQEISQSLSPVNNVMQSKLSQITLTISAETSPQRMQPDASIQLSLLDSGKKRKKPKRGSLTEQLQTLVNRQMSSVRLWRYQLRRMMESGTPAACVTVFVRRCVSRLGRQFLEGVVVQDPHGLSSYDGRFLRIMVVPEVSGKIDMKSGGLVQIFPPWQVLDDAEPMLNVTFIRVVAKSEADDKRCESMNVDYARKCTVIEEFDCPCIGANKMIVSCEDRFRRPNVIRTLFKRDMR